MSKDIEEQWMWVGVRGLDLAALCPEFPLAVIEHLDLNAE